MLIINCNDDNDDNCYINIFIKNNIDVLRKHLK